MLAMMAGMPDELLLNVLSHLDIPELLSVSRTSRHLRTLALDPLLHARRLAESASTINSYLPNRPSASSLARRQPPILVSPLAALRRTLGRHIVAARLKRNLERRPALESLVERGVLPGECFPATNKAETDSRQHVPLHSDGLGSCAHPQASAVSKSHCTRAGIPFVSWSLVERRRSVERERVRDKLRAFVQGGMACGIRHRRARIEDEEGTFGSWHVRGLVRRWTRLSLPTVQSSVSAGPSTSNCSREKRREDPPRARVRSLRTFWEGIAQGGNASSSSPSSAMPLRHPHWQ